MAEGWRSKFSQRFRYARLYRELTTGEDIKDNALARLVGYSAPWIALVKAAAEPPPWDGVEAIARVCGVDPGWLAHGEATDATAPKGWAEEAARLQAEAATVIIERAHSAEAEARLAEGAARRSGRPAKPAKRRRAGGR